jgi:hypothetical protein
MASELRVNTLKDASGNNSVAMTYVAGGSAKALCLYDAVAQATENSLNQSSLSDNSTGDFTTNFTNAFSARGVVSGISNRRSFINLGNPDSIATTSVNVTVDTDVPAAIDRAENCIVTHGVLA